MASRKKGRKKGTFWNNLLPSMQFTGAKSSDYMSQRVLGVRRMENIS